MSAPDPSLDPQRTVDPPAATPQPETVDVSQPGFTITATGPSVPPPLAGAPSIPGYRITAEIAQGGMGRVYAGLDLTLDRKVAIKTLLPGANAERFVTEAKITARLPHPNIPPVHALGTLPDGTPWLAMKLIHGQTLAKLLASRERERPQLPRYVQIFEQIAQAVGFAHSRGVIHRDLKPLNVMVGEFGEVQVMDWGLAKDTAFSDPASRGRQGAGRESNDAHHTAAGAVMGTPGYMAPEQARGQIVDARADVFALGSILATILTGKPAFVGSSKQEMIATSARADLADVLARLDACGADAELLAIARRCLAAQREDRFADSREVAAAVAAYRAGVEARLRQAETERAAALVRETEQRKRRRQLVLAASVIFLTLVGGLAASLWQMQRAIAAEGQAVSNAKLAKNNEAKAVGERDAKDAALKAEQAARQEAADRLTQIELINNSVFDIFTDFDLRKVKAGKDPVEYVLTDRLIAAGRKLDERAIHDPLVLANLRDRLGQTLLSLGRAPEAIEFLEWSRDTRQARLGPDHPDTLTSMNNLAEGYRAAGQLDLALPLYEETLKLMRAKLGADHPDTLTSMNNLGKAYCDAKQGDKAASLLKDFVAGQRKRFPKDDPRFAGLLAQVSLELLKCDQFAAAEAMLRECLAIREKAPGANTPGSPWELFNTMSLLGGALLGQKKYAEAEPLLLKGYAGLKAREKTPGANAARLALSARMLEALDRLIELYTAWENPDEAKKWQAERAKRSRRSEKTAPEK